MDAFDLDPRLLTAAFSPQTITLRIVQDLTEWIRNTSPSINLLTSIFNEHLACKQCLFLKTTVCSVPMVLTKLQDFKCPKIVIRAYLAVIKANKPLLNDYYSRKEIVANWKYVNVDLLEYYCSTFEILIQKRQIDLSQIDIFQSEVKARIEQLIESKQYDNAINLIKIIDYPEQLLKMLFQKMNNSKEASKAATLMKVHKINPQNFTSIGQRLNKNTVRYFLKSHGWEVVEQIFENNNEALACLVQDLVYKDKTKQALSIWYRHKAVVNQIKKKQTLQLLTIQQNKNHQDLEKSILQNSLHKDYFGPQDSSKYLTLEQFGITQQKIIWINSDSPSIDDFLHSLKNQQQMSIDTESIVGKNKLDRKVSEQVSIIQIAFSDKVYLLDGLNCKNIHIKNGMINFIESRKLVLGHALQNDINGLFLSVGFTDIEIKSLKMNNVVDTCKLFKTIHPNEKYSNLAYISKKILGKQVCKKQTMTNWARRPLRDNQIHYAAMDAFVVIKIFQRLKQEVGEKLMEYFLDLDE